MRIAYFDCHAGASGDMILGALIDAGADPEELRAELDKLHLPGWRLSAERTVKQGFAATRAQVLSVDTGRPIDHTEETTDAETREADRQHGPGPEHAHGQRRHAHAHLGPHRHLADIVRIIQAAPLAEQVKDRAIRIFSRLAQAEAKVHGVDVDSVHFHEVGAVDAIVDIVGACVAVELLGVEQTIVSPLPPGSGEVRCAHGLMPVPTPATAELLKGVPLAPNRNAGELVTPTGAAVLTTLADRFADALPAGAAISAVGVGAGSRDGACVPNVLRVMLADSPATPDGDEATADTVTLLETNLDDADGVTMGHCFGLLADAGALDVWATPIVMKKNRPAYKLSVLCPPASAAERACRRILFTQTGTFGVREQRLARNKLAREHVTVETPYGPIRVKVGRLDGAVVQAQPEYEDCRSAADRTGASLAEVRRAAVGEFRRVSGRPQSHTKEHEGDS